MKQEGATFRNLSRPLTLLYPCLSVLSESYQYSLVRAKTFKREYTWQLSILCSIPSFLFASRDDEVRNTLKQSHHELRGALFAFSVQS